MNTKDYLFSASSYKEYQQCGLKFRYKRVDKIPSGDEISHHRWFGRIVHDLVYIGLAERNGSKDYTLRDKAQKRYATSLVAGIWDTRPKDETAKAVMEGAGDKPENFFPGTIQSLQGTPSAIEKGWEKQARTMVGNGITALSPILNDIIEIEAKLLWKWHDRRFIGYVDIISKEDGKIHFYDLKTAWNKPGKSLEKDFQFYSYSLALKEKYNLDYYPTGHWVHLKDGSVLDFDVTQEIIDYHDKDADQLFERLENDVFPASLGSPLCRFCDYRNLCYGEDFDWEGWKPTLW